MVLRSILCPVDFSEQSRHALGWAAELAGRCQSRLVVLTAVDPLLAHAAAARFNLDLAKQTEAELREFATATVSGSPPSTPQFGIDVRVGSAAEVILDAANRESADLIAMGTHGLGGFRKLLLGSTTERILRNARTPLLAVPLEDPARAGADTGARLRVDAVLMATDFSEASAEAFQWATDLAQQLEVTLVLAHVVAPVGASSRWQSYGEGLDDERVAQARARLDEVVAGLSGGGSCVTVALVGRPAEAIAALAEQRQAGVIVMGQTGEQGALGPRPGSTAYRVVCLSRVPVLVVPRRAAAGDR